MLVIFCDFSCDWTTLFKFINFGISFDFRDREKRYHKNSFCFINYRYFANQLVFFNKIIETTAILLNLNFYLIPRNICTWVRLMRITSIVLWKVFDVLLLTFSNYTYHPVEIFLCRSCTVPLA